MLYDCRDNEQLMSGMRIARQSVAQGKLVVIPTDTVYGVAADAFSSAAVFGLLEAKGRTRQSPPPVLIPEAATMDGLARNIPDIARELANAFWPGGLTIVLEVQESLAWDLGDTNGTVALRVPAHPVALELLKETGPLAVSSANLTGNPAATTATEAQEQLGNRVAVYLDAGTVTGKASTIVDATQVSSGGMLRVLRAGAISATALRKVAGSLLEPATRPVKGA